MTEAQLRSQIVRMLAPLHPTPVENPVGYGTPDINCVLGWIELKRAEFRKNRTLKLLSDLTPQQQLWLRKRWAAGGLAVLLVRLQSGTWYIFRGDQAHLVAGRGEAWLNLICYRKWDFKPSAEELISCLEHLLVVINYQPGKRSFSLGEG